MLKKWLLECWKEKSLWHKTQSGSQVYIPKIHPKTLDFAVNLISSFEGCELEAYLNPVGIPTICTGVSRYPNGSYVMLGDVCQESICDNYIKQILINDFRSSVSLIPGWDYFA